MQAAQFRYVAHFLAISKIPTNCRAAKTESRRQPTYRWGTGI